jgi:hypothetical protein
MSAFWRRVNGSNWRDADSYEAMAFEDAGLLGEM